MGAIHEGAPIVAKCVDTIKEGAIQRGAGGKFGIRVEVVFDAVSEQKFVSENILRAVEYGLPGNEALSRNRKRVRCRGFLCGRIGLPSFSIRAAVAPPPANPHGASSP